MLSGLKIEIAALAQHAADWAVKEGKILGGVEHTVVQNFVAYVEGTTAETDAVALLESKGYKVTAPPYAAPQ